MLSGTTISRVQTPIIPTVGEWVRNTPGTLSLGQGMVAYPPPAECLSAIENFGAHANEHYYGASLGDAALIERIEEKLKRENGLDVDKGYRVMVTAGANMAFLTVLLAILDPGDEVILPLPYYFNQEMAIRMLNAVPVTVPTTEDYQLDVDAIAAAITPKTKAIVTVSPNNPTGAVFSEWSLRAVNRLCRDHSLLHISDEAYDYFVYEDARHFSPGSIADAESYTVSLFSLSKAYGFASWRVGYAAVPATLIPALLKVQDTNLICPPLITQKAALAAIIVGSSYCQAQLPHLQQVRDQLLAALMQSSSICPMTPTQGAFYQLVKLNTDRNDVELVRDLIRDYQVAAIPGSAFGLQDGAFLRLSYGMLTMEQTAIAADRLLNGLAALC
jgi:aspartate/methionine/tyrosine aminotransferase